MSKNKDWIGNKNSIWKNLGVSNHTDKEREPNDYYATDPIAIDKLLKFENISKDIWECAVGNGNLAQRLKELGYNVKCSDIIDRGYDGTEIIDFLQYDGGTFNGDIITNPPYKYAKEFVLKSLETVKDKCNIYMFLKLTFLEGKARYKELFSKYSPKTIYVFSERIMCAKNGDFEGMKAGGGSAVAYAWFVWQKGYIGDTIIRWI